MGILSNIFMTSGVNEDGKPFVTIAAHSDDGIILVGQLSPQEIRQHALAYMEVAEAADQDAAILRIVRELDMPEELAALVIVELREYREKDK